MMRINFSSVLADVFSQYTTADELKSAANAMCAQIKEAYEARFKELTPNAKTASKPATAPAAPAKPEAKSKRIRPPRQSLLRLPRLKPSLPAIPTHWSLSLTSKPLRNSDLLSRNTTTVAGCFAAIPSHSAKSSKNSSKAFSTAICLVARAGLSRPPTWRNVPRLSA